MARFTISFAVAALAFATVSLADEAPRVDRPRLASGDEATAGVDADADDVIVRDVMIYRGSQYATQLSGRTTYKSAMPRPIAGRRESLRDATQPGYGGLMTFEGPPVDDVDILLEYPKGERVMSHPSGEPRSSRELWQSVKLASEPGDKTLARLPEESWVSRMRNTDRLWLTTSSRAERGLLYDLAQTARVDARLQLEGGKWSVANESTRSLRNVLVAVPSDSGEWSQTFIPVLESSRLEKKADENKKTKETASEEDVAKAKAAAETPAGKMVGQFLAAALGQKAALGRPAAKKRENVALNFEPIELGSVESVTDIAAGYAKRFDGLGEVERAFIDGAVRRACENGRAVVFYELGDDDAAMLTTLDISPNIGPIRRHAFVAAIDLDPRLTETMKQYISDLGSDSWTERVAADDALRELGQAAIPELRTAAESKDAEVALRAERIIADFEKTAK